MSPYASCSAQEEIFKLPTDVDLWWHRDQTCWMLAQLHE